VLASGLGFVPHPALISQVSVGLRVLASGLGFVPHPALISQVSVAFRQVTALALPYHRIAGKFAVAVEKHFVQLKGSLSLPLTSIF
jgi:hypothetical protein